jgi:hypothetical protein
LNLNNDMLEEMTQDDILLAVAGIMSLRPRSKNGETQQSKERASLTRKRMEAYHYQKELEGIYSEDRPPKPLKLSQRSFGMTPVELTK